MTANDSMGRFFDWLAKPMDEEDIIAWYLANNITKEHTELFRDFCLFVDKKFQKRKTRRSLGLLH